MFELWTTFRNGTAVHLLNKWKVNSKLLVLQYVSHIEISGSNYRDWSRREISINIRTAAPVIRIKNFTMHIFRCESAILKAYSRINSLDFKAHITIKTCSINIVIICVYKGYGDMLWTHELGLTVGMCMDWTVTHLLMFFSSR